MQLAIHVEVQVARRVSARVMSPNAWHFCKHPDVTVNPHACPVIHSQSHVCSVIHRHFPSSHSLSSPTCVQSSTVITHVCPVIHRHFPSSHSLSFPRVSSFTGTFHRVVHCHHPRVSLSFPIQPRPLGATHGAWALHIPTPQSSLHGHVACEMLCCCCSQSCSRTRHAQPRPHTTA
jgi:hypothetical protein